MHAQHLRAVVVADDPNNAPAEEARWWSPASLVLDPLNAGAVFWQTSVPTSVSSSGACVYDASEAPYLHSGSKHDDMSSLNLRISENLLIMPKIALRGPVGPEIKISKVSFNLCMVSATAEMLGPTAWQMRSDSEQAYNIETRSGHFIGTPTTGKRKVTFSLAYHYSVSVDVSLTGAQLYTMTPITFVRHLSKGQVRFLTSSKFTCRQASLACEAPLPPYKKGSYMTDGC